MLRYGPGVVDRQSETEAVAELEKLPRTVWGTRGYGELQKNGKALATRPAFLAVLTSCPMPQYTDQLLTYMDILGFRKLVEESVSDPAKMERIIEVLFQMETQTSLGTPQGSVFANTQNFPISSSGQFLWIKNQNYQ